MDRFQYLIVMALCVLITLPLEFFLNARVYRRPGRLLRTMVPAFGAFVLWDVVAIRLGHWTFSSEYTTGWKVGSIPIEELVFFIVIPLCALLSYEAVSNILRDGWMATLRAGSLGRFLPPARTAAPAASGREETASGREETASRSEETASRREETASRREEMV